MSRALKAALAAVFLFASPAAIVAAGPAIASPLAEAYNGGTDHDFRVGMQMRLAWTGDYAGSFAGTIDAAALRAIRDFQARHGMEANGVIDEAMLRALVSESDLLRTAAGFTLVEDRTTGARIGLPLGYVSDVGETGIGRAWRSADRSIEIETVRLAGPEHTVASVHAKMTRPAAGRTVDIDTPTEDGFAIAGTEGGRAYAMRFKGVDGDVRGFGISYDPSRADVMKPYAVVAENLFDAFAGTPDAPEGLVVADSKDGLLSIGGAARGKRLSALIESHPAAAGGVADEEEQDSSGTGFVVSRDGWILTNAHVAGSCKTVLVGDKGIADKILVDEANDLAAVHVSATLAEPLPLSAGIPRLGEDVLALGFPLRSILADSLNVTRGNVSSLLGLQNDSRYLQMSAPIQPGNSGGPLVDLSGRVVGVVTAKLNAVAIADVTGDIPQSINFAIRPDTATAFLNGHGIDYVAAKAPEGFDSVADTTAKVQDAILPILCVGGKADDVQASR